MNRNTLRMAAISAVAAVSLGAGAGLAQASEATTRPAATANGQFGPTEARALLSNPAVAAELRSADARSLRAVADGTATEAQTRSAIGGAAKALFKLLKKYGGKIYNGAVKAAKAGWSKFRSYMNGLPWYHPVRVAWVAAGAEAQYQLYTYIRSLL
jgi:hypothetical protein